MPNGYPETVWGWAAVALVLSIGFVVGWATGSPAGASVRPFLSTLAGIQGGILALLLSVFVLGLQFVSWLSSPWLVRTLLTLRTLRTTAIVFVTSLVLNLGLLYILSENLSRFVSGLVGLSSALTVVGFVFIYASLRTVLAHSTPERILDTYRSNLTPQVYHGEATTESGGTEVHPLYPLYAVTVSAGNRGDWRTFEQGYTAMLDELDEVLDACLRGGVLSETTVDEYDLFRRPLELYLPSVAENALKNGQPVLGRNVVEHLSRLGERTLTRHTDSTFRFGEDAWSTVDVPAVLEFLTDGILRFMSATTQPDSAKSGFADGLFALSRLALVSVDLSFRKNDPSLLNVAEAILRKATNATGELLAAAPTSHEHVDAVLTYQSQLVRTQDLILSHYESDVRRCEESVPTYPEVVNEMEIELPGILLTVQPLIRTTGYLLGPFTEYDERSARVVTRGALENWAAACLNANRHDAAAFGTYLVQAYVEAGFLSALREWERDPAWVATLPAVHEELVAEWEFAVTDLRSRIEHNRRHDNAGVYLFEWLPTVARDPSVDRTVVRSWTPRLQPTPDTMRAYETWVSSCHALIGNADRTDGPHTLSGVSGSGPPRQST